MNAPSRPRPSWSVASYSEWYVWEPGGVAVNSYVIDSPGTIGSWVKNGTPSWVKSSNSMPWKWTPVDAGRLLVNVIRTRSPSMTRIVGPGQVSL